MKEIFTKAEGAETVVCEFLVYGMCCVIVIVNEVVGRKLEGEVGFGTYKGRNGDL